MEIDPDERSDDLYAVLNVSRDASSEEVTKAYRKLAFVFHPDKHPAPDLKDGAQEAFGKLQEAYEILSDERKRQIYDIYGKQGLTAGFELGDKLRSREELKREWEDFKKKREQQEAESSIAIKGLYQCRVDATEPLRRGLLVRSIVVTNSADIAVGEGNFHIQGQAAVRNQAGSGNIVFGYTRPLGPHDTLEGMAVLGLRSMATLTSTRQLGLHTSATTTVSWGPQDGVGLTLGTTRQLPYGCTGTHSWVVGPRGAGGMSLQVAKRGNRHILQGKVEVGAVTGISARATLMVSSTVSVRAVARLGSTGIDLEVGASNRFSEQMNGYLGTQVGLMGVVVKARVTRSNQTLEFPFILSHHWDDWRMLAVAAVAPPVAYLVASRLVVRPLLRWHRKRAERALREEHAEEVSSGLRAAASERALLSPVASRKARTEAARKGLVILEAAYGIIPEYRRAAAEEQTAAPTATGAAAGVPSVSVAGAGASSAHAAASSESARIGVGVGEAPPAADDEEVHPPRWIRVTEALQYLVVDSRLVLHPGVSKAGLMAFTDPAPGADSAALATTGGSGGGAERGAGTAVTFSASSTGKQLYVAYLHGGGTVREVLVDDLAGLDLPSGNEVPLKEGGAVGMAATPGSSMAGLGAPRAGLSPKGKNGGKGGVDASAAASTFPGPPHAEVTDVWRRDWLLRRGAECLGLDLAVLVAGVRAAAAEAEAVASGN